MEKINTKDKILLAALDLFSERGYDEASIDMIAEAAESSAKPCFPQRDRPVLGQ